MPTLLAINHSLLRHPIHLNNPPLPLIRLVAVP
jgi:hypothetical protein